MVGLQCASRGFRVFHAGCTPVVHDKWPTGASRVNGKTAPGSNLIMSRPRTWTFLHRESGNPFKAAPGSLERSMPNACGPSKRAVLGRDMTGIIAPQSD